MYKIAIYQAVRAISVFRHFYVAAIITNSYYLVMGKKKKISQIDVALASGVSQPLVSAVFNHSTAIVVSESTRAKVLAAANSLGYSRRFTPMNAWGRPRTKNIAWVVTQAPTVSDSNQDALNHSYENHYQQLFNSAVEGLAGRGFSLIVKLLIEGRKPSESLLDWLDQQRIEAVLWRGSVYDTDQFTEVCRKYPVVIVNRSLAPSADKVAVNEDENISLPIEYLAQMGHQKIAYFGHVPAPYGDVFAIRKRAYERVVDDLGLRIYREFFGIPDALDVPSATKVRQILELWRRMGDERPTAIILNDVHALHLLQEAHHQSVKVPEQLSVIGIDNVSYGLMSIPALSSMQQPFAEMGRIAVEMLLSRLEDPARLPRLIMVSPRLVSRESVATPKAMHVDPVIRTVI